MADIFVCYRRADSRGDAGRLADSLDTRFRDSQVFRDVESLDGGVNYKAVIETTIARCAVLLAVIGPRWLDIRNGSGARRLDDEDDFIRLEIGAALNHGVTVIPVLVGGAQMPAREQLPGDLQALAGSQAMELSDSRWDYDVARLIDRLAEILPKPPFSLRSYLQKLVPRRRRLRWPAMLVAIILLLAGVTQFAAVGDEPVLDDRLRLLDVNLESAAWAEGNCIYPKDCNSRDGSRISSTIRVEGAETRRDPRSRQLHMMLSIRWVLRGDILRDVLPDMLHRGYTGKVHYTATWERSAATGRVVLSELKLQDQSIAPFNGLLAFTFGCIEIPLFSQRDSQVRDEIKRRLEHSAVVQSLES